MNQQDQRIAIAKACGMKPIKEEDLSPIWQQANKERRDIKIAELNAAYLPDYLNDLNAMHEAWRDYFGFFSEEWVDAYRTLIQVVNQHLGPKTTEDEIYYAAAIANATAAQRAEAFLKTLNLWTDESIT